ncbi:hypothetical protein SSX86_007526 [Deinandra increscens subsp. villosa]|uniref:Mitochondrial pyruvate carrier n=1 Tax=Deinandra increscens subsp. villosa TaxID=3103831 RepID=A0AAP0DIC5_9ASTR
MAGCMGKHQEIAKGDPNVYAVHAVVSMENLACSVIVYKDQTFVYVLYCCEFDINHDFIDFWGPVANWGFVAAAMADIEKPPEMLSGNMTGG